MPAQALKAFKVFIDPAGRTTRGSVTSIWEKNSFYVLKGEL